MKNSGAKIQTIGLMVEVVGVILSLIGGLIAIAFLSSLENALLVILGIVITLVFCLSFIVIGIIICGYGELVENAETIKRLLLLQADGVEFKKIKKKIKKQFKIELANEGDLVNRENVECGEELKKAEWDTANENECPSCFAKISPTDIECKNCGYKLT